MYKVANNASIMFHSAHQTKVTTGEVEESSGSDSPVNAEVRLSISNLDSILTRVAKFW
jgi:hypothetical protein